MTIEEKARAYDEAIEQGKHILKAPYTAHWDIMKEVVEYLLPQLKESEDDRIRKWIIDDIRYNMNNESLENSEYKKQAENAIAWLERQVNKKTTIYIPKFNVGDRLVSTKNPHLTYEVLEVGHINELGNPEYKVIIFADGKGNSTQDIHYLECQKVDKWGKLIEQKPSEWSEEDEKEVAVLEAYILSKDWSKRHIDRALGIVGELVNKVKLSNPQNRWRPSEEQIEALEWSLGDYQNVIFEKRHDALESLYNDLKKLIEQ